MAAKSALFNFIALVHGDRVATLATASEAFALDFGHFARSNNREPLNEAVKGLNKSPKDKAIGEAIAQGYKAAGLVIGYIGAQSGKFASQPDDVKAAFEAAIVQAVDAFTLSLNTCEAFATVLKKTVAERDAAKAAKADKASEAVAALINEKIKSGELVRSVDVHTVGQMADSLLLSELSGRENDNHSINFEGFAFAQLSLATLANVTLSAEFDALKAEFDALKAEFDALKATKPKAAKPAKVTS